MDGTQWTAHRQPAAPGAGAASAGAPSPAADPLPPYARTNEQGHRVAADAAPVAAPAPKRNGCAIFAAIGCGIVLVIAVIVALVFGSLALGALGEITSPQPTRSYAPSALGDSPPLAFAADRPGYAELVADAHARHDEYARALSNGTIYKDLPETEEGVQYAETFVTILADLVAAVDQGYTATDAAELDAWIERRRDELETYEQRFLAREDLEFTAVVERADGTSYTSRGIAPSVPDPEEFARGFRPHQGDDGTYVAAASELAAAFGVELSFDDESSPCETSGTLTEAEIGASYCHITPNLIYINDESATYTEDLHDPYFVQMVRHELAHHRIGAICGTPRPPIVGASMEGVTNSYAVLFLGGDRAEMNPQGHAEYAMTDATDAAARAIHEDRCE